MDEYLYDFRTWLKDAGFLCDKEEGPESWIGNIRVEWLNPETGRRCTANHKIAVILPAGFPYHAPIVISRDDPPLAPSWHFSPSPLYSLCLWDSQDGWQPHFTARRLLQRVKEWFTCYHTDRWPTNSQFPDLHLYLKCRGIVVIGDEWQPPPGEHTGTFILWIPKKQSKLLPSFAVCPKDAFASLDESQLANSLHITPENRVKSPGIWFRLTKPFFPANTFRDLLSIIDKDFGQAAGWAISQYKHAVGRKPPAGGFPVALGYNDYQNQERWLFLWVQLQDNRKKVPWSFPAALARIPVTSLQTAAARKADLLRRTAYISNSLEQSKVIIFGAGSLGGSVALLLAQAGINEIRLVDDDVLLPGNVVRHACGLDLVGLPKTYAVKHNMLRHHPTCKVCIYPATWGSDKLSSYIEGCDLVIDATANHNFSLLLNEVCVKVRVPTIFATTYRRATIGRIILYRDHNDPCLACYVDAPHFWDDADYPIIPSLAGAQFIEDGCGTVTEEAVALDVNAIGNLTARIAVKMLRREWGSPNLGLLVSESIPEAAAILTKEGMHWRANRPLEHCVICCRK